MTPPPTGVRAIHEPTARSPEDALQPVLQLAFSRLHKAAFGVATGAAGALLMGAITFVALVSPAAKDFPLQLLEAYFTGYSVTWPGLVIGMIWGFLVSFVAGWFLAFCRNLTLAIIAFNIRVRAELQATRTFLDHI